MTDSCTISRQELAKWLHERYEKHAQSMGWHTQKKSRKPYELLPPENRMTMELLALDIKARFCMHEREEEGL